MNDLFATASAPAAPAPPAYGSLSHQEEFRLRERDRAGWIAYVAPGFVARLNVEGADAVAAAWPFMGEDYRAAVWKLFDQPMRRAAYAAIVAARERPPELEPEEAAA